MKRERGARRKVRVIRSRVPSRSSNEEHGSRRLQTCGRSTSACSIKEYDSIKNCWKRAVQDWVSRSSSRELPARRRSRGRFTRLAANAGFRPSEQSSHIYFSDLLVGIDAGMLTTNDATGGK